MPSKKRIPVGYLTLSASQVKKGNIIYEAGKVASIERTGDMDCWVEDGNIIIEEILEIETISPATGNTFYHLFGATEKVGVLQYAIIDETTPVSINIEKHIKPEPLIKTPNVVRLT